MDARARRTIQDAVFRVAGEDARVWLNGQVTNEVRTSAPGRAVYTLILNTRGKILSDALVVTRGDALLLLVPERVSEAVRAHLEDHVIMEDVVLERTSDRVSWVAGGDEGYPCERFGFGRIVLGDVDGPQLDEEAWKLERLRRGIPELGADFGDEHYPQEAGLKRAVSFEKGCYLGQEVVCMLENRGQLTRRLVKLEGPVAEEGAALTREGKTIGAITSAVVDPETGKAIALGYVKRAFASVGTSIDSERGTLGIVAIVGETEAGLRDARAL